jgi:very-short-patch-repair endonuclease
MPAQSKKTPSKPQIDLEGMLIAKITENGLPAPQRQSRLPWQATKRMFRADFLWPDEKLIVEVQGAVGRGRHTTAAGFMRDRVKMNLAQLAGYRVLEVCAAHIRDGSAIDWITEALGLGEGQAGRLPPKKRGKAPRRGTPSASA